MLVNAKIVDLLKLIIFMHATHTQVQFVRANKNRVNINDN